jgi:hypothetical protein
MNNIQFLFVDLIVYRKKVKEIQVQKILDEIKIGKDELLF